VGNLVDLAPAPVPRVDVLVVPSPGGDHVNPVVAASLNDGGTSSSSGEPMDVDALKHAALAAKRAGDKAAALEFIRRAKELEAAQKGMGSRNVFATTPMVESASLQL
jgi:hypothetical protein